MEEELKRLSKQLRRTRVGGILGLGVLGLVTAGTFYHLKVSHHHAFQDIYEKHRSKDRACPVFDWKKYDPRNFDFSKARWIGYDSSKEYKQESKQESK